jgi:hypothetical protein
MQGSCLVSCLEMCFRRFHIVKGPVRWHHISLAKASHVSSFLVIFFSHLLTFPGGGTGPFKGQFQGCHSFQYSLLFREGGCDLHTVLMFYHCCSIGWGFLGSSLVSMCSE